MIEALFEQKLARDFLSKRYDQVIESVLEEEARNSFPQQMPAKAYLYLGLAYYMSSEFEKCFDIFKDLYSLESSTDAWFYLTLAACDLGFYELSSELFNSSKQIEIEPKNLIDQKIIHKLIEISELYKDVGQFDQTEKYLLEAKKIQTSDEVYFKLGKLYLSMNRLNEAKYVFEQVKSDLAEVSFLLGIVCQKSGMGRLAQTYFKKAQEKGALLAPLSELMLKQFQ